MTYAAITDLSKIDTTPGAECPFAPPADFAGGEADYDKWFMREYRYGSPVFGQMVFVLSRLMHGSAHIQVAISGPFAGRLRAAMRWVHGELKADAEKARAGKVA